MDTLNPVSWRVERGVAGYLQATRARAPQGRTPFHITSTPGRKPIEAVATRVAGKGGEGGVTTAIRVVAALLL